MRGHSRLFFNDIIKHTDSVPTATPPWLTSTIQNQSSPVPGTTMPRSTTMPARSPSTGDAAPSSQPPQQPQAHCRLHSSPTARPPPAPSSAACPAPLTSPPTSLALPSSATSAIRIRLDPPPTDPDELFGDKTRVSTWAIAMRIMRIKAVHVAAHTPLLARAGR